MYEPNCDKRQTETAVEFDDRLNEYDDFDDRIVVERTSKSKDPQPGRRLRNEEPLYLSLSYDDLDEYTGNTPLEECTKCNRRKDNTKQDASDEKDLLRLLTPTQKLGYNMHCRECGTLLTQLGHAPVKGIVVLEQDLEIPSA